MYNRKEKVPKMTYFRNFFPQPYAKLSMITKSIRNGNRV